MLVSLIHPSRGRASQAIKTASNWILKSDPEFLAKSRISPSLNYPIEWILSIDSDDPDRINYEKKVSASQHKFIVSYNNSVVEATNKAARESTGDILIYLSDDFDCPLGWWVDVMAEFEGVEGPCLLKVDDCLQNFHVPVLTIPIMNRALYERLGYFWYPEYKSMFCDTDLFEVCKKNNWLKLAPHLKFPHNHVSVGKAPDDETYRRSAANWDQGKALFAKRKAAGFPV